LSAKVTRGVRENRAMQKGRNSNNFLIKIHYGKGRFVTYKLAGCREAVSDDCFCVSVI